MLRAVFPERAAYLYDGEALSVLRAGKAGADQSVGILTHDGAKK